MGGSNGLSPATTASSVRAAVAFPEDDVNVSSFGSAILTLDVPLISKKIVNNFLNITQANALKHHRELLITRFLWLKILLHHMEKTDAGLVASESEK